MMASVSASIGQLKWERVLHTRPLFEMNVLDKASRGPWGSFLLLLRRTGG